MNNSKSQLGSVLLILDDAVLAPEITTALSKEGFTVRQASGARPAFVDIFKLPPDLIILDINLPDLDGFHVAKELKRNMMLRHIPLILLSSRMDFLEKIRTLDVVVDEYLVKPLDMRDLVLRTKFVLQRAQSNLDANPLTRLPGNIAIVKTIKSKIGAGKPYAIGYADLNNFKAYNDKYGFSNGDQVIRFTAQLIVATVQRLSPDENFVGHIGGDDFVFVCGYEKGNEICQIITETFDKEVKRFYTEEDQNKGYIVVEDRRGVISQFPFVSVAIGMVSDEGAKFNNLGQVNHSLTQLKKYAKSFQGSAFVRDRRSLSAQLAEFTWGPGSSAGSTNVLENIATALGSYLPGQLAEIISKETLSVLFQPILDMRADEVAALEGLVRGPSGSPLEYPDALFQTARTSGCVPQLDTLCIKKIIEASLEFHKGIKLFVNVFPETLLDENAFYKTILEDSRLKGMDFVFELAGSHRASDAGDLFATLRQMKHLGLKICIDAAVAFSEHGLRHMPELRPEYIKLNMLQYKEMVNDYAKQDEFIKAVGLIRQAGSEVICTKLESRTDSFLALKAGVALGQGFLFARPSQSPVAKGVKS